MADTYSILGYHGTYERNIDSILKHNFWESVDHQQWYGDGVYFFVHGLSDPIVAAEQYALDTCYVDRRSDPICVLEANIDVNSDFLLDMTQTAGLHLFNEYRDRLLKKIKEKVRVPTAAFDDHDIMRHLRKNLGVEFVKGNVYIRFGMQRIAKLYSVIPNVTIFVVNNPTENIDLSSITKV